MAGLLYRVGRICAGHHWVLIGIWIALAAGLGAQARSHAAHVSIEGDEHSATRVRTAAGPGVAAPGVATPAGGSD